MPTPKISVKSIMNGFERNGGNDVKPFGAWVAAGLPIPASLALVILNVYDVLGANSLCVSVSVS